ncbi:MAG: ABC transporter ATP-binding protein [Bacteroidales bacterium]|nr:ABC transporter ATP-binding protein [Bacteroidales bacterium]
MLKIENISKSFKTVKALQNIDFEVNEGELFGLVGPDGAGKTTLFNILVTLTHPDEGKAFVGGFDVGKDYRKIKEIIGYLPGQFSLYADLSCYENLDFFATLYGNTIEENYEIIKPIWRQLEPFKKRRAGKLSGGMKQKLALCCALVHRPLVLFLDEPTTGVDPVSRREFWDILKELKKKNITILVSTPYMDEASLCDRVGLIQDGKMLKIGTPTSIVNDFSGMLFSMRTNDMYRIIKQLSQCNADFTYYPFGQHLHIATPNQEETDKVFNFLEQTGDKKREMKATKPTIEDCFIQLIRGKMK